MESSVLHLCSQQILNGTLHVLGTALVAEEASKNKTDKNLCLSRAYNLAGEAHNKGNIRG